MRPQYSITVQPASEPISLQQASDHLRVDSTDDREYIADLIPVAREYFDAITGRASAVASYLLTAGSWADLLTGSYGDVIEFHRSPLVSIESVSYFAPDATEMTVMDVGLYRAITGADTGRLQFTETPPSIASRIDAVSIAFTAGTDSPPAMSKHAIKMLVANFYEQRVPIAFASASEIPYTLRALIENQRIGGHF